MKQFSSLIKSMPVLLFSTFTSVVSMAQDSLPDVDLDFEPIVIDSGPFYAQLWFWVVIGVVFLLLLIFLIRGSGGKKKPVMKVEKKKEEIKVENVVIDNNNKDEEIG